MRSPWVQAEWNDLSRRLRRRAQLCGRHDDAALCEFCEHPEPSSYLEFLAAVRRAAELVSTWPAIDLAKIGSADKTDQICGSADRKYSKELKMVGVWSMNLKQEQKLLSRKMSKVQKNQLKF